MRKDDEEEEEAKKRGKREEKLEGGFFVLSGIKIFLDVKRWVNYVGPLGLLLTLTLLLHFEHAISKLRGSEKYRKKS